MDRIRRVFVTGSSDGLGRLAAQRLAALGHEVVLHARNRERAQAALDAVPAAAGVLVADFSRLHEVKRLAEEANAWGRFDAVIHNAGVYRAAEEEILAVNLLAPYILTCLMHRPERLIYITSGLHLAARPNLQKLAAGKAGYAASKLYLVALMKAVARRWPDVLANAVDPGWVPTKMGGPHAPDPLEEGVKTQVWLAVSDEPRALVSGRCFHHMRESRCHELADDVEFQEAVLDACARLTGVPFPDEGRSTRSGQEAHGRRE